MLLALNKLTRCVERTLVSLALQSRMKLVRALRKRGVYVRWHAFEFLLGWQGRIAGVLLLEPLEKRCSLYCISSCEELLEVVRDSLREAGFDGELVAARSAASD